LSTPHSNDDIEDEGGVVDEDEAVGAVIVAVFGGYYDLRTARTGGPRFSETRVAQSNLAGSFPLGPQLAPPQPNPNHTSS